MSEDAWIAVSSAALAVPILALMAWYATTYVRRPQPHVQNGDSVIASAPAYLRLDGSSMAKLGTLVLTNQFLLWTPTRFPFPRVGMQQVELVDIAECRVDEREPARFERWLIIAADQHQYHLRLGVGRQEAWRDLILSQRSEASGRNKAQGTRA